MIWVGYVGPMSSIAIRAGRGGIYRPLLCEMGFPSKGNGTYRPSTPNRNACALDCMQKMEGGRCMLATLQYIHKYPVKTSPIHSQAQQARRRIEGAVVSRKHSEGCVPGRSINKYKLGVGAAVLLASDSEWHHIDLTYRWGACDSQSRTPPTTPASLHTVVTIEVRKVCRAEECVHGCVEERVVGL